MNIGFVTLTTDPNSPSGRLRAFNLIEMINNNGLHKAELYTPSGAYDALVFIKACRPQDLSLLKSFQGLTILDLCDNLLEPSKYTDSQTVSIAREMAHQATCVSVCSEELGTYANKYNENIFYIPDLTDVPKRNIRIMWFGLASNWRTMQQYIGIFAWLAKKYKFEIHAIADWNENNTPCNIPKYLHLSQWKKDFDLKKYDLFFSPKMLEEKQWEYCKSSNKVMLALHHGLDVIASPIPEYEKIAELFPSKMKCFHDLMELDEYLTNTICKFDLIQNYHSREQVFDMWMNLFKRRGIQVPTVSVITAVYNGEKTIDETIQSVVNQTYDKFEYIIVDDCSTDGTLDILKEWVKKDSRIKLIQNKSNLKQGKSRNKAIKASKGKYITNIDADDLMEKDRLNKMVAYLQENKNIDLIYCGYTPFHTGIPFGMYSRPREYDEEKFLNEMNLINNSSTMWRRGLFYDTRWDYAEDYSTWLKAIKVGYKICPLDINATFYRYNDFGITRSPGNLEKQNKEKDNIIKYWREFNINSPSVSIIMPTYNRRRIIPKSIETVLAQSFQDWELIIVNDGGEDISKVVESYHDSRIKYFTKPNGGLSSALNFGIERARAPLIALLDDDDLWIESHLMTLYNGIGTNDIVYTNCERITPNGQHLNYYNMKFNKKELLHDRNLITTCSVMFKKHVWNTCKGFDEGLASHMDWDFWKKAVKHSFTFHHIDEYTSFYIAHGGNMLLSRNPVHEKDRIMVRERYVNK